jgi:ribonuclease HI
VYDDWASAQAQIKDVKGPKYKKFATRSEAEAFVQGVKESKLTKPAEPATKKARMNTDSSTSTGKSSKQTTQVYTDGSSLGNGRAGSLAGVGVFFGINDERYIVVKKSYPFITNFNFRNVSEPLKGHLQTNQRAELTAVLRTLQIIPNMENLCIITDSKYTIQCCTEWYENWEKNNWRNAKGTPVMNKDLVEAIRALINDRDAQGTETTFKWIKGHSNDPSNEAADRLAVAGARMARN